MDLNFSTEHVLFQDEVRTFIQENLPQDLGEKRRRGLKIEKDDIYRWHRSLFEKGWIAPNWPIEYGGCAWDPVRRYIFDEELARAHCPPLSPFGLAMVGPVIYTFGDDNQKKRYLPKILSGQEFWCQGYSEPGAGSDLASLQTRAERNGDHYIVNGQKTWTSYAQWADHIFCLVRTSSDGKQQEGISFLLIDMKSPGIDIKPIMTMDGGAEVNNTYFDNVKVPAENLIGEENKGWTYAKFLLGNERSSIAQVGHSKAQLRRLKDIAREEKSGGQSIFEDPDFRKSIADLEIKLKSLEITELRFLMADTQGEGPGAEVSMLKIRGTEIQQELTELSMKAVGMYAHPFVPEALDYGWNEAPVGPDFGAGLSPSYFNVRKASIYGGSNEIQKNIMAKMVLGL
ncbi:MAG: Caffeyl-CoA reductase-Etf complex subunit CarC [Alphaproteobacteria bacterium MarineAlpha4_Bin2]|nr:MAG: Caffeyl-CoA reductase-Etf complex subunit CarC [Alphaproteobacteria bacterium MarineAlpha4_Bin2]